MPIYHRICPYCQDLCVKISNFPGDDIGRCNHLDEDFNYHYSESKSSIAIDIVTRDIYMMIEIVGSNKSCFIKTSNGQLLLENSIPIDWNDFDLDRFVCKINKIVEMKTFC